MNKYQDALSRMYNNVDILNDYFMKDKLDEDYNILWELIDRATPKKPLDMSQEPYDTVGMCPSCREWIRMEYHSEYCGDCGQALDWR